MARRRSLIGRLFSHARQGRRAFSRDENGAVVLEFAFLSPIFFALIYAILETSVVFLAGQILDSAVQDASRDIRTGQPASATATLFRAKICDRLYGMFDCSSLKIRVEEIASFASASVSNPISNDPDCDDPDTAAYECWTITESYDSGASSTIVLVQVFYRWPTIVNLPYANLGTLAGGGRLLSAVRVFKNEPF
jgi:Flp pilus assembly protein TadG